MTHDTEERALEHAPRHGNNDEVCSRLHRILVGRRAAELLEEGIPGKAKALIVLPSFRWAFSIISVGRKDRQLGTGDRMLMPVRNVWSTGPLVLLDPGEATIGCVAKGMGHDFEDTLRVQVRDGAGAGPASAVIGGDPLHAALLQPNQLHGVLNRMVEDGKVAQWEQISSLEAPLVIHLRRSHLFVSRELGGALGHDRAYLDKITLEAIHDEMVLGSTRTNEDGEVVEEKGSLFRLIDLCLKDDCFERVDPMRYINKHLQRDAEKMIRKRLDDPHIGPKIRKVAKQYPGADVDLIIEKYREVYPKDRLARKRAEDALAVIPETAVHFDDMASFDSMPMNTSWGREVA